MGFTCEVIKGKISKVAFFKDHAMRGVAFLGDQHSPLQCRQWIGGQETGVSQGDSLKQVTDAGGPGSGDGNGDRCVRIRNRTPEPAAALVGRGGKSGPRRKNSKNSGKRGVGGTWRSVRVHSLLQPLTAESPLEPGTRLKLRTRTSVEPCGFWGHRAMWLRKKALAVMALPRESEKERGPETDM